MNPATQKAKRAIAKLSLLGTLFMVCSSQALAHSVWIVPSHTSLSGDRSTSIAVDSSISNDIFHADMAFGGVPKNKVSPRLERMNKLHTLTLVSPSGETSALDIINFGRKSVGEVPLTASGTYKITMAGKPRTMIGYTDKQDKRHFSMTMKDVPSDAKTVTRSTFHGNTLTYVTFNQTSPISQTNTGKGLELAGSTHPNDLFVGEAANFQLLLNGEPIAGVDVKLTPAGTRWRNARGEMDTRTDADGRFSVTWKDAGMYLLEARHKKQLPPEGKAKVENSYGLSVSLEVMAE